MKRITGGITVAVMTIGLLGASPAVAQPLFGIPGLPDVPEVPQVQDFIDNVVVPALPKVDLPPEVAAVIPGVAPQMSDEELLQAIMPSDVGDSFFDVYPANLTELTPGQIIEVRDITGVANPSSETPVEYVKQIKFRTTGAHGDASFGTASLIVPSTPWTGQGARPVVVNNLPIDSLGRTCTPGYGLATGADPGDTMPPLTMLATARGYAALIPDHQGPKMAFADPYTAGHIVLDSIRALRSLDLGFSDSRYGMQGYSGGAIASNGAAKLINTYAPDLSGVIVGVAVGGPVVDYSLFKDTLAPNVAKGLFGVFIYGLSRENPEILSLYNDVARQAAPLIKDWCGDPVYALGVIPLPLESLSNTSDVFNSPVAQSIYTRTIMGGMKYGAPVYIYNGANEFWFPASAAIDLYNEQCAMGVSAVLRLPPGEHFIAAVTGLPEALLWLDARLQGTPAPNEC